MDIHIQTKDESPEEFKQLGKSLRQILRKQSSSQAQIAKATGTALKRSLMSFDKLNRLNARSGGKGSEQVINTIAEFKAALTDDKALKQLQEPLQGVVKVFREFGIKLEDSEKQVEKMRLSLLELPLPMRQLVSTAFDLGNTLEHLPRPVDFVASALSKLEKSTLQTALLMGKLPVAASDAAAGLENSFLDTVSLFRNQVCKPLDAAFGTMFTGLRPAAQAAMTDTKQIFSDGAGTIAASFKASWQQVLSVFSKTDDTFGSVSSNVVSSLKSVINRLIGGINTAIVEPFSGINAAFFKLKNFKVNGLYPFKNLDFNVSMPSIPFLASGAVLPANKPFMAVVGDQKHGTNIEAPLATIEQAVATVMEDMIQAQLAGQKQTVQVLGQILEAVIGIRLDEDSLGRAAQRYSTRQAIMTGGF